MKFCYECKKEKKSEIASHSEKRKICRLRPRGPYSKTKWTQNNGQISDRSKVKQLISRQLGFLYYRKERIQKVLYKEMTKNRKTIYSTGLVVSLTQERPSKLYCTSKGYSWMTVGETIF